MKFVIERRIKATALSLAVSYSVAIKIRPKMNLRSIVRLFVIAFICVALRSRGRKSSKQRQGGEDRNFHEVDAFGDDFIDFGAQTGAHGQFSWHADFPIE